MIVYRQLEGGAFVAGDTETGFTSYAYPSSGFASDAKKNPVKVASLMMKKENEFCSVLTEEVKKAIGLADTNARQWAMIGGLSAAEAKAGTLS